MQITINNQKRNIPAVWREGSVVKCLNQTLLPHAIEVHESRTWRTTATVIQQMIVRGAGTIGATAAYGMAQAVDEFLTKNIVTIENAYRVLLETRPTAVDLKKGLQVIKEYYDKTGDNDPEAYYTLAEKYSAWMQEQAKKIGETGAGLIKEKMTILTVCNAGALALVDWGSALSPVRIAKLNGTNFTVLTSETRPRLQGARITAWELLQEGIDHKIITDNSIGLLMMKKKIDLVIVGADRVAANGDVANKIGTYMAAVLAERHGIPFYVAIPASTFDPGTAKGEDIIIEERSRDEVKHVTGQNIDLKIDKIRIAPLESDAYNFAFDITPAELITGYITPEGIFKKDDLKKLAEIQFTT